jgi:hypothetical protein
MHKRSLDNHARRHDQGEGATMLVAPVMIVLFFMKFVFGDIPRPSPCELINYISDHPTNTGREGHRKTTCRMPEGYRHILPGRTG